MDSIKHLRDPANETVIAVQEGEVVGGCTFKLHATFLELILLATNKHKQGLGSDLVRHLAIFKLPIVVFADNRALKFFLKLGFKYFVRRDPDYNQTRRVIHTCYKASLMKVSFDSIL